MRYKKAQGFSPDHTIPWESICVTEDHALPELLCGRWNGQSLKPWLRRKSPCHCHSPTLYNLEDHTAAGRERTGTLRWNVSNGYVDIAQKGNFEKMHMCMHSVWSTVNTSNTNYQIETLICKSKPWNDTCNQGKRCRRWWAKTFANKQQQYAKDLSVLSLHHKATCLWKSNNEIKVLNPSGQLGRWRSVFGCLLFSIFLLESMKSIQS